MISTTKQMSVSKDSMDLDYLYRGQRIYTLLLNLPQEAEQRRQKLGEAVDIAFSGVRLTTDINYLQLKGDLLWRFDQKIIIDFEYMHSIIRKEIKKILKEKFDENTAQEIKRLTRQLYDSLSPLPQDEQTDEKLGIEFDGVFLKFCRQNGIDDTNLRNYLLQKLILPKLEETELIDLTTGFLGLPTRIGVLEAKLLRCVRNQNSTKDKNEFGRKLEEVFRPIIWNKLPSPYDDNKQQNNNFKKEATSELFNNFYTLLIRRGLLYKYQPWRAKVRTYLNYSITEIVGLYMKKWYNQQNQQNLDAPIGNNDENITLGEKIAAPEQRVQQFEYHNILNEEIINTHQDSRLDEAPFRDHPHITWRQILLCLLNNEMNQSATARNLGINSNTFRDRWTNNRARFQGIFSDFQFLDIDN